MERQVQPVQNPLNCWKLVKTHWLQRKVEINLNVNATKVEKTNVYGIWLNPKCFNNRQSAGKPRIEETSTTIP